VLLQKRQFVMPVTPKNPNQSYLSVSGFGFIKRRSAMFTKKILTALVLLAIATTLATTNAFANAPGGAYIQCDGGSSSPVRCTPDSW
jgi:hypothetical protein